MAPRRETTSAIKAEANPEDHILSPPTFKAPKQKKHSTNRKSIPQRRSESLQADNEQADASSQEPILGTIRTQSGPSLGEVSSSSQAQRSATNLPAQTPDISALYALLEKQSRQLDALAGDNAALRQTLQAVVETVGHIEENVEKRADDIDKAFEDMPTFDDVRTIVKECIEVADLGAGDSKETVQKILQTGAKEDTVLQVRQGIQAFSEHTHENFRLITNNIGVSSNSVMIRVAALENLVMQRLPQIVYPMPVG